MVRYEVMVGAQETHESGFMTAGWPRRLLKREGKEQEEKKGGFLVSKRFLARREV